MNDEDIPELDSKVTSVALLADCLQLIEAGNPAGFHNLAFFWMGHVTDCDPVIELGVAEALLRQSARMGNPEAEKFLLDTWPDTRRMLERKLDRQATT
jgi:hypothetical protein